MGNKIVVSLTFIEVTTFKKTRGQNGLLKFNKQLIVYYLVNILCIGHLNMVFIG